jgi:hypothetical protein
MRLSRSLAAVLISLLAPLAAAAAAIPPAAPPTAPSAAAPQASSRPPACDSSLMRRNGHDLILSLADMSRVFSQRLHQADYHFSNLRITSPGPGALRLSAQKDGKAFSLSGPLTVARPGVLRLHARHIRESGSSVKGMMGLFGQDLHSYLKLTRAPSLRVKGNSLLIYPSRLLGVRGQVTRMALNGQSLRLRFNRQPCR